MAKFWNEWHGGECPVDVDEPVVVKYRDGKYPFGRHPPVLCAGEYCWLHSDSENPKECADDIVGYILLTDLTKIVEELESQ